MLLPPAGVEATVADAYLGGYLYLPIKILAASGRRSRSFYGSSIGAVYVRRIGSRGSAVRLPHRPRPCSQPGLFFWPAPLGRLWVW